MSMVIVDGFDHYTSGSATAKGWSGSWSSMVTGRFSAGQAATLTAANTNSSRTLALPGSARSEVWCGAAIKQNNVTIAMDWLNLSAGATDIVRVGTAAGSGRLQVRTAAGSVLATGVSNLVASLYYFIEVRGKVNGASGEIEVWMNGAQEIATTTVNIGSTNIDNVGVGMTTLGGGLNVTSTVDDLYVLDTAGSSPVNTRLGDVRVEAVYPTGDGANTQWALSTGSSHFAVVDEAQANGDTDYASDSTSGHVDEYTYGSVSVAAGTVFAVATNIQARRDEAGDTTIADVIRQSGTDNAGTTRHLATNYLNYQQIHEQDPASATWTLSTIPGGASGVQVGVKIV